MRECALTGRVKAFCNFTINPNFNFDEFDFYVGREGEGEEGFFLTETILASSLVILEQENLSSIEFRVSHEKENATSIKIIMTKKDIFQEKSVGRKGR